MVLQKKLSGDIPPPTNFYPDIAPEVVAALMGALATEREDRTGGAAALGKALEGASALALKRQAREAQIAHQRLGEQARAAEAAKQPAPPPVPSLREAPPGQHRSSGPEGSPKGKRSQGRGNRARPSSRRAKHVIEIRILRGLCVVFAAAVLFVVANLIGTDDEAGPAEVGTEELPEEKKAERFLPEEKKAERLTAIEELMAAAETEQSTSVPTDSGKSSRARQRESRRRDKEAARTPVKTLPKEDAAVQPSKGTRVLKLDSAPREFSAGRRAKFRVSMPNHQSGEEFVVKMRMQCGSDGAKWRSYDLKQVGRNQWGRLVLFEDRDRGICKYYFVARPTEDTRTVSGDISLHSKIKPYTVTIR
jgi:hypothetical protein